jgi:hypothetical protein
MEAARAGDKHKCVFVYFGVSCLFAPHSRWWVLAFKDPSRPTFSSPRLPRLITIIVFISSSSPSPSSSSPSSSSSSHHNLHHHHFDPKILSGMPLRKCIGQIDNLLYGSQAAANCSVHVTRTDLPAIDIGLQRTESVDYLFGWSFPPVLIYICIYTYTCIYSYISLWGSRDLGALGLLRLHVALKTF